MTWIQTYTGKAFDLLDPQPEQICIQDIARALQRTARFNGHTEFSYSVAQHSIAVSKIVPAKYALDGLLHDAHEAYTGDVVKPLKDLIGDKYAQIEQRIQAAIADKYNISRNMPMAVKQADLCALLAEKAVLYPKAQQLDWGLPEIELPEDPKDWLHRPEYENVGFSDFSRRFLELV